MNKTRLHPGRFVADSVLCLSQFQGEQQLNYRTVKAGEEFEVPVSVNGFGWFLVCYPDFGDAEPQCHQLVESK